MMMYMVIMLVMIKMMMLVKVSKMNRVKNEVIKHSLYARHCAKHLTFMKEGWNAKRIRA